MSPDRGERGVPAPRRIHLAMLLVICASISIYGSWIPFHFVSKSFTEALADFSSHAFRISGFSRSDWAANFLLFLPVGFSGVGIYQIDRVRRGWYWVVPVLIVTATSAGGGVLLEFSQEWFAGRVPSSSDICAQTIGSLVGALGWTVCGQFLVNWARRWTAAVDTNSRVNNVLVLAVAMHVLSLALPLDLTIRPSDLWHKYKAGAIDWRPFHNLVPTTADEWFGLSLLLGGNALAGWLMVRLQKSMVKSAVYRWLELILAGLSFCSVLEIMQLLVYSRASHAADILWGTLGFIVGAQLLPAWTKESRKQSQFPGHFKKLSLLAVFLIWLFLYFWWPLDFNVDPENLKLREGHFFRLPFSALYAGSYANLSVQILSKTFLFAMLTIIVAWVLDDLFNKGLSRRTIAIGSLVISLGLGILLEVGQLFLPSRTADFTDVLLYGIGAGCGMFLVAYLQAATELPTSPNSP